MARVYYTSNATLKVVIALLFTVGLNLILVEAGRYNLFSIAAIIVFHAWLFGRVTAYMAGGVFSTGILKWVHTLVSFLVLLPLICFSREAELALTAACALALATVLSSWVYSPGKMNGDNDCYSEDEIDTRWFDRVDDRAYTLKVSFPMDIGCGKKDRLEGTIEALGRAAAGKYEGEEAALVTARGKRYVCPIRYLKPAELTGGDRGVVIACNSSQEVSFISWKDGEKPGGVFYVFNLPGPQA